MATRSNQIRVLETKDFDLTGDGEADAWSKADCVTLPRRNAEKLPYETKVKLLYSIQGLYVLFDGTDAKLTATKWADFYNLWQEDVIELFLWPDEKHSVYFENEIAPLGAELPIPLPNFNGKFLGWRPWHYEGARKTRKATSISGGEAEPGSAAAHWTAEVFILYSLLEPLQNVPPKPGTQWRANFYRVDYDDKQTTNWSWVPVGTSFHEYQKFGTLFE